MKTLGSIVIALAMIMMPLSANAEAQKESGNLTREEIKEVLAAVLNMQGFLCAKVTDVTPLAQKNLFEVRCIEYRGGRGTVDYILDTTTMKAFKR